MSQWPDLLYRLRLRLQQLDHPIDTGAAQVHEQEEVQSLPGGPDPQPTPHQAVRAAARPMHPTLPTDHPRLHVDRGQRWCCDPHCFVQTNHFIFCRSLRGCSLICTTGQFPPPPTSWRIQQTAGLVTNSIIFCWTFHNQGSV